MKTINYFIILLFLTITGCDKEHVSFKDINQSYPIDLMRKELINANVEVTYNGELITTGKWEKEYLTFYVQVPETKDRQKYKMTFKKGTRILFEGKAFTLDGNKNRELFKIIKDEKYNHP